MALRDIRKSIPFTKQTDPNEFPDLGYQRYPLAPVNEQGVHYLDEFSKLVLLHNPEEEEAFKAEHPDMREVRDNEAVQDELTRLREENAKLKFDRGEPDKPLVEKPADDPPLNTKPKLKLGNRLD